LKTLHQSPIRIKSKEISMPPVRYREPRKSAVPCRIQLLFSDQMVISQPSLVYDIGSNNLRTTDKTATNQIWWLFQPLYRFTVLANSVIKTNVSYSTSGVAELGADSENGSLKCSSEESAPNSAAYHPQFKKKVYHYQIQPHLS
jgi:hypothetical protein